MKIYSEKVCTVCGVTFTPTGPAAKTCGRVCSEANRAAHIASSRGRAVRAAWELRPEVKAKRAKSRASAASKANRKRYAATPKAKATRKRCAATPKAKAARAVHDASPRVKASMAAYRSTTEGKAAMRAGNHRRRDRLGCVVPQRWVKRLDVSEAACYWCGVEGVEMHVDHLMPVVLGGPGVASNLHNACVPCNQAKSGKHPLVWIASLFE